MCVRTKTKIILSFTLAILVAVGVGAVWAWNVHQVSVENVLQSRTVETIIEENFDPDSEPDGKVTKEVSFTNSGSAAVFLRFTYASYWETEDELLEGDYGVTLNWSSSFDTDWTKGEDGWYYYNKVVGAGKTVEDVLKSVTFDEDKIPADAQYTLFFQMETVQVSDEADVNADATSQCFGMVATVSGETLKDGAVVSGDVEWTVASSTEEVVE